MRNYPEYILSKRITTKRTDALPWFRTWRDYTSRTWPLVSLMDHTPYDTQSRDIVRRTVFPQAQKISLDSVFSRPS